MHELGAPDEVTGHTFFVHAQELLLWWRSSHGLYGIGSRLAQLKEGSAWRGARAMMLVALARAQEPVLRKTDWLLH